MTEKNRKFDITNYGDRLNREAKKAAKKKLGGKVGGGQVGLGAMISLQRRADSEWGLGFFSIILKILKKLEFVVTNGIVQMKKLETYLLKFAVVLYLPKGLLLILILLIMLSELLSRWVPELGFLNDKQVLHHVYSICKFMNILLILIATLMGAAKVTDKLDSEGITAFPFPLLLLGYIIASMPLLYELLSLLALSSIVLAYYSVKCDGKIPNTWGFVENISGFLLTLGGIGFILALLQFKMKKKCPGEGTANLRSPTILMLTSISYFLILIVASGFEKVVSKNVGYWIGLLKNGGNPTEECYSGDEEKEDEGFTKVLNMILSIVITIVLLVIIIIGCLPPIPPISGLRVVNAKIRMALWKLEGKIFGLLMA